MSLIDAVDSSKSGLCHIAVVRPRGGSTGTRPIAAVQHNGFVARELTIITLGYVPRQVVPNMLN